MSVSLSQYYNMKADSHPFACKGAAHANQQAQSLNPAGKGAPSRNLG